MLFFSPTPHPFNNYGLLADGTARCREAHGKAERAAPPLPTSAPARRGAPGTPNPLPHPAPRQHLMRRACVGGRGG